MEPDPGEYHLLLLEAIPLLAIEPLPIVLTLLGIGLLLYCSAMISGSEVAYFSISSEDVEGLQKEKEPSSNRIVKLLESPKYLLATILIANNFLNIAIVVLSTVMIEPFFEHQRVLAILVNVILVTSLLVLFGEVAPKVYASSNYLRLAKFTSRVLLILRQFLFPFSYLLVESTSFIENSLQRRSDKGRTVTMEDIDQAIELTVKSSDKAQQEATLLKSIVQFGNVSVDQIMKARVDVVAINSDAKFYEILEIVRDSGFSRMPVYSESFDQIKGILYAKDLLKHLEESENFNWIELIRPPFFVPEARKIDDLLNDFQEKRIHMAIVVDEYGGTSGIVTLEDVLEEIIGEIKDEFDDEDIELEFQRIDDFTYIFEGKTMLNDVTRLAKLDPTIFEEIKGDANSLAGLVLEITGRIPRLHDEVLFSPFTFKVMEVDKRRIKRIKFSIDEHAHLPKPSTDNES